MHAHLSCTAGFGGAGILERRSGGAERKLGGKDGLGVGGDAGEAGLEVDKWDSNSMDEFVPRTPGFLHRRVTVFPQGQPKEGASRDASVSLPPYPHLCR